jgi:hypothetical protein
LFSWNAKKWEQEINGKKTSINVHAMVFKVKVGKWWKMKIFSVNDGEVDSNLGLGHDLFFIHSLFHLQPINYKDDKK